MYRYRSSSLNTLNQYTMSIYDRIDRHPKKLVPVFGDMDYDMFFWTDENIFVCPAYDEKNYGWLTESEAIVPSVYVNFNINLPSILDNFVSVFSHKRKLVKVDDRIKWVPASGVWIKDPSIYDKKKLVSMITSTKTMCDGHLLRIEYMKKFSGSLDLFGNGIRPIEFKEEGLSDYMFSVAIENAYYSGYFTEKILDCFATGTIPVYLGDPDIGMEFNEDGIIKLNEDFDIGSLSTSLYESKIDAIIDNFNRVKRFLTPEDYIYENYFLEKNEHR